MKFRLIIITVCLLLVCACGNNRDSAIIQRPDTNTNLDLSSWEDNLDISGIYTVTIMVFDSDVQPEYTTEVTVSPIMRHVEISKDGEPSLVQAAIEDGLLMIHESGNYSLSYNLTNASDQDITIGNFSNGTQSGKYDVVGDIVTFYPDHVETPGLAYSSDTSYKAAFELGNLMLRAEKQSLYGEYLTEVKGVP